MAFDSAAWAKATTGGAGVASTALNPLALGGIGLGAITSLFGGRKTPSAGDLRKHFGPGALSQDTMMLYRMLANSPAFRATLAQNAAVGSRFSNQLTSNLAQRGLTTSGIGSVAQAAGKQAISTGETGLRGGLFQTAQEGAMQNLLARLQSFTALQGQSLQRPTGLEAFGSSLLAGGAQGIF